MSKNTDDGHRKGVRTRTTGTGRPKNRATRRNDSIIRHDGVRGIFGNSLIGTKISTVRCVPKSRRCLRLRSLAAKLLTKDEARRIAANIAKLPEQKRRPPKRPPYC